ncbi:MAG: hypothetical protein R3A78_13870 [Polyangiales bacterium]|nr:hypothetical protein [Myxococcales bacterium]
MRPWLAIALLPALVLGACSDLDTYKGTYGGGVVGTDDNACSDGSCSFIRRGFPAGTELTLVFDPDMTEGVRHVSTTDGAFDTTPLERIDPLQHDRLSQFDFPGGTRVQNYIFAAHPTTGPLARRDPLVFVSLMDNDSVEVRIIVGKGDYFGVFVLDRK